MTTLSPQERQAISASAECDTIDYRIRHGRFTLDDLQRLAYFNGVYPGSLAIRPAGMPGPTFSLPFRQGV